MNDFLSDTALCLLAPLLLVSQLLAMYGRGAIRRSTVWGIFMLMAAAFAGWHVMAIVAQPVRVVDPAGRPISGAEIVYRSESYLFNTHGKAKTDIAGALIMRRVRCGRATTTVTAPGMIEMHTDLQSFDRQEPRSLYQAWRLPDGSNQQATRPWNGKELVIVLRPEGSLLPLFQVDSLPDFHINYVGNYLESLTFLGHVGAADRQEWTLYLNQFLQNACDALGWLHWELEAAYPPGRTEPLSDASHRRLAALAEWTGQPVPNDDPARRALVAAALDQRRRDLLDLLNPFWAKHPEAYGIFTPKTAYLLEPLLPTLAEQLMHGAPDLRLAILSAIGRADPSPDALRPVLFGDDPKLTEALLNNVRLYRLKNTRWPDLLREFLSTTADENLRQSAVETLNTIQPPKNQ